MPSLTDTLNSRFFRAATFAGAALLSSCAQRENYRPQIIEARVVEAYCVNALTSNLVPPDRFDITAQKQDGRRIHITMMLGHVYNGCLTDKPSIAKGDVITLKTHENVDPDQFYFMTPHDGEIAASAPSAP